jgi:hypothetical protein
MTVEILATQFEVGPNLNLFFYVHVSSWNRKMGPLMDAVP